MTEYYFFYKAYFSLNKTLFYNQTGFIYLSLHMTFQHILYLHFMSEDKNCMAKKKLHCLEIYTYKHMQYYVRGYNFIFSLVLNRYESHHYEN